MSGVDLDRIEPSYQKAIRGKWKAAKDKHAAALKAKGIVFAKDLGPLLDKRPPLYKAIRDWKSGNSLSAVKAKYDAIKANAKEIEGAVKAYQKKITGLGDPAEKELRELLNDIQSYAVEVDYAYSKLK